MTTFLQHHLTEVDGHKSLTVFDADGYSKVVDQGHPYFTKILQALIEEPQNRGKIEGLIDPEISIREAVSKVSNRVTVDRNNVYVDGMAAHGSLAKHIIAKIHAGDDDWGRFVRFLLSLWENPSAKAQEAVWAWVEKHGVTITEDGRMVGYKGLVRGTDLDGNAVPTSYHAGPNNFIDGVLYGETDKPYHVPHVLGTTISKRRADVDDNDRLACSTGLHVGGYSYAKTFGENREDGYRYSTMGKMASTFALVAFAAQDVVSVPSDGTTDWKIRVTKYEVLEFLDEVADVLDGKTEYAPAKVEVPVKVAAPFLPKGQVIVQPEVVKAPFTEAVEVEIDPANDVVSLPKDEDPVVHYEIVRHDDFFGDVVQETFPDLESAEDALETVWQAGDLDGDFEVITVHQSDLDEDDEETADLDAIAGDDGASGPEGTAHDGLVVPEAGVTKATLTQWVEANPGSDLVADLNDRNLGHKPLARKYSAITSEASVRRFRNAAGIKVALRAKVAR